MRPQTKYARSGSLHIAYQISGDGPVDMVWAPGTISHLDLDWELPAKARFIQGLSAFTRLIRFDKRGTGLSDRPLTAATLEERTDDIRAVMDAAKSASATIFGVSEGAQMACVFAATYPQWTRSLIVWGAQARWVQAKDYPWGLTAEGYKRLIEEARENWPSVEYLTGAGAGVARDVDPAVLEWWLRYFQAGASPAAVAALEEMNSQIDIRDILPTIRVPTLVMNITHDPLAHVDAARALAAGIPGARFVEFPGTTHSPFTIPPEPLLAEIRSFVTGAPKAVASNRFLTTLVFLDIVRSTERAAVLGDEAWRDLLERYYALARRELRLLDGVEVDRAGDGLLARFDGPARAIRCAVAIREAARHLGIEIRFGLHSGECEAAGERLVGIAVHIGARIVAAAQPGEVLVSSTVKDLVVGSGIEFQDRGFHVLKGVPGEWRLFSVKADRSASTSSAPVP